MASHPQNTSKIEHLIRLSAASRGQLSHQAAILRQRFDVPGRLLQSLRGHPLAWLGGGLASTFGATLLLRRCPTTPKRRRGWRGMLGSLALSAARPVIKNWLIAQVQQFVLTQLQPAAMVRPGAAPAGRATPPRPV
ncbi:MAG: hypothetical protein DVB25_02130 [Verrucomicrobia bacterium]|nr:MAG: hypothetical protein DVB25_02130 [Verrucomicrobiota bacterium]